MDIDHIVEEFLIEQLKLDSMDGECSENKQTLANCNLHSIHEELEGVKKVIKGKKEGTVAALRDARRENLYYLLNVKADWQELLKKPNFLNLMTAKYYNELGRRINQIKNKLEEAIPKGEGESSQHKDSWFNPDPKIYRWSSQAVELKNIHGFEDKGMIMERMLLKEGVGTKAVGIVGWAGVGKTALCQLAFNRLQVRNYFPLRIWLCFSNQSNPDADDAMKKILSCLGFEDELIEEVGKVGKLQLALRSQLKRGRYLIVLDDVWTTKVEADRKFFSFLIGDGKGDGDGSGHGAGTLIFTSRYENLDKMLDHEINKHTLLPLADDESCWNIFSDAVKKDGNGEVPDEMMKLKEEIVRKCEGLPLMAKMLGLIGHNDLANKRKLVPQTKQAIQTHHTGKTLR